MRILCSISDKNWALVKNANQPQLHLLLKVHYERCGQRGGFNTRGRSRRAIFGISINGESLTFLNLIGYIRHAH